MRVVVSYVYNDEKQVFEDENPAILRAKLQAAFPHVLGRGHESLQQDLEHLARCQALHVAVDN